MLFIDEEESVRRQLLRGQRTIAHNAEVDASGVGEIWEVRKTDLDEASAHRRYKTFKESTYDSLTNPQGGISLPFHKRSWLGNRGSAADHK